MKTYRVLMKDTHNGQPFNFAIFICSVSPLKAMYLASAEFALTGACVAEVPKEV